MLYCHSLRLSCFPDLCLLKYKKEDFVVYDINLVSITLSFGICRYQQKKIPDTRTVSVEVEEVKEAVLEYAVDFVENVIRLLGIVVEETIEAVEWLQKVTLDRAVSVAELDAIWVAVVVCDSIDEFDVVTIETELGPG